MKTLTNYHVSANLRSDMLSNTIVAAIATLMAILGMELIALQDGRHVDLDNLKFVIPLSIGIWLPLSLILQGRSILVGAYVGFLSPFLGGLFAFPPYGLVVVFGHLAISIGIGLITGLGISVALRFVEKN